MAELDKQANFRIKENLFENNFYETIQSPIKEEVWKDFK